MTQDKTQLTIGVPVYNGAKQLATTLDNLLKQTYSNYKIIISNNGSTDGTTEICDRYAKQDPRISVVHHAETTNPTLNFRFVLDQADTPYFMWCAHDDTRDPDFAEKLIGGLEAAPDAILAFGDILQYKDGAEIPFMLDFVHNDKSKTYRLYWSATRELHHLYGVWRTESLQNIRWEHTNWWHDTPLMMAASLAGDFLYVPGPRLHYLCNKHHFFDKGINPRQLLIKTGDLLHLIYQSGKTVTRSDGILSGFLAAGCTSLKITDQIFGNLKTKALR